jgi:metal-sulfur cluster biosynthetic enzyme
MPTEDDVIAILREIVDPHTNMNIYDMGLISGIEIAGGTVRLVFRPTSEFCPLGVHFAMNIKRRLSELQDAEEVDLKIVGHVHMDLINEQIAKI